MFRRFLIYSIPATFALLTIKVAVAAENQPTNSLLSASNPIIIPAVSPSNSINVSAPSVLQTPLPSASQPVERSSYSSIHVDGPYIAMTFDDGPHPTLTPKLLDILKERNIHVTFFVLGQMVKDHPEILQREVAEGHEIGNHTWDHLPLTKVVNKEGGLKHEIVDTSELIKQVTGNPPTLLRPPYGATTARLSHAIEKEYGLKVILWSVDPDDWKDPGAHVVEERILSGWKESGGSKPGAIILSHDIHKGTIEAMPATLDALLAKGFKFVTVSELIALESKNPAPSPSPTAQKAGQSKKKDS